MSSVIINPYYVYPSSLLLLDEAGLGSAAAAYSVRKLRSAYSGSALRVRRSSDSTEQDIGFSGNNLDTSSNSFTENFWYLDSFVRNGASSKVSFNGGSDFTGTCNTTAAEGVTLFNFGVGGGAMAGKIHEYVVWASALSNANRTTARNNQNAYFSIY